MISTFILFFTSLIIILIACELFSNGIEWFGHRLELGEGAVGSILAAIGTALPETIIPIFAILLGNGEGRESIGIGEIIGSSFMLATLAMFVVGTGIFVFSLTRGRSIEVDIHMNTAARDLKYFLLSYSIALIAALISYGSIKIILAIALLLIYVQYFRSTIADCGDASCDLKPLHFHKKGLPPRWRFISIQIVVALGVIIYGAHLFIEQVMTISHIYAIPALVLSLLVTPIATELPEKFNSLIWVRNKKDTLALGNITGAMVFQSCILPAFGMVATPWKLSEPAIVAALLGITATIFLYLNLTFRSKLKATHLVFSGLFYLGFIVYVLSANTLGESFITKFIAKLL